MECRMDGKTALITGGSLGLGYGMAEAFVKAGAEVAIVARREEILAKARDTLRSLADSKVECYVCDVSKADEIVSMFDQVIGDFGKVDVLINNAGFANHGPLESLTDEDWQHDLDLKLMSAIRLSRLVYPGMKERRWGRIINMLNTMAKAPMAKTAPTSVTRAAGMAFTKVLASEGAPHNILVNSFNIGRIKSDQIQRAYDNSGSNLSYDEFVAEAGKSIPLGRFGESEECASLACYLCSDQGGYITGTSINVDGGLSPVV